MKVYINQKEIAIFAGACILDALLAYSKDTWKQVSNGELSVYDRFGNLTDPDGPIQEGQQFTIKRNSEI